MRWYSPRQLSDIKVMQLFAEFRYMAVLQNSRVQSAGHKFRDRVTGEIVAEFKSAATNSGWVVKVYYTNKPKRVQALARKLRTVLLEARRDVEFV